MKAAAPVWRWLCTRRGPLALFVAGVEGGVGASTTAALLAETVAAGSIGPTALLDQCGCRWGAVRARVLGEHAGLDAAAAVHGMRRGAHPARMARCAPHTSGGAAVVDDAEIRTPVEEIGRLTAVGNGTLIVDAGRVDLLLTARMRLRPVVVLVARADLRSAEAACAALAWFRRTAAAEPVLLLDTVTANRPRQVAAARRLLGSAGPRAAVLPFDKHLAHGRELQMPRLGTPTVTGLLGLLSTIASTTGGVRHVA